MAQRLQRVLGEAGGVSSVGSPLPPDTSTAQLIRVAGETAGSFVRKAEKENLTEELTQLGREGFAVAQGEQLEESTNRIKRLKQAKEQGRLSNTMMKIEAETVLKEAIEGNPVLGDDLRRAASDILGFDPTGAATRALFDLDQPKRPLTQEDKIVQQAEMFNRVLGLPVEEGVKIQVQGLLATQRASLVTSQATLGAAGREQILQATIGENESHLNDINAELLTQVRQGGVRNPQEQLAIIETIANTHKAQLRGRYQQAGLTVSSGDLSKDTKAIDELYDGFRDMARDGSLLKVADTNFKSISTLAAIEGFNAYGDVATVNKLAGQEGVKNYYNILSKLSSEGQLRLMMKNNPALARQYKTQGELANGVAKAWKSVMGFEPAFAENKSLEDVVTKEVINTEIDSKVRNSALNHVQARGQAFRDFGDYFETGVRVKATPEEVSHVKAKWEQEYDPLLARMAASLEGTAGSQFALVVEGGRVVAKGQTSESLLGRGGQFGLDRVVVPSQLRDDIIRVNSMSKGLTTGWSIDVGHNPLGFLQKSLNKIDTLRADVSAEDASVTFEDAYNAVLQNPTQENIDALRKLDPDLVSSAERQSANKGGSPSGDSNSD